MQHTGEHQPAVSVSGARRDDAHAWLQRRLGWERRLAQLERRPLPSRAPLALVRSVPVKVAMSAAEQAC